MNSKQIILSKLENTFCGDIDRLCSKSILDGYNARLRASGVRIDIYDVMGRRIKSLINTYQVAGHYSTSWNAENELGEPVPAGMYICSMHAGEFRKNIKMILIK